MDYCIKFYTIMHIQVYITPIICSKVYKFFLMWFLKKCIIHCDPTGMWVLTLHCQVFLLFCPVCGGYHFKESEGVYHTKYRYLCVYNTVLCEAVLSVQCLTFYKRRENTPQVSVCVCVCICTCVCVIFLDTPH